MRRVVRTASVVFLSLWIVFPLSAQPPAGGSVSGEAVDNNSVSDEKAPVQVESRLDGAEGIRLGDTFRYIVSFTYPNGVDVRFPPKPFLGAHLKLAGQQLSREPVDGGLTRDTYTLDVVSFRTGRQKIAAIEVPYIDNGTAKTLKVAGTRVSVKSRLANETAPELRPPTEPTAITEKNWPLIWTLAGLGIALFTALVTLLVARVVAKRLRARLFAPPPRPAHEIAYDRLSALLEKRYPDSGDWKQFHLELSEIVREYFGNRYRIAALGETTTELIQHLRKIRPAGIEILEVENFMWESDLVKFAKVVPTVQDADNAIVKARLFVDRTREEARERQEAEERASAGRLVDASPARRAFALMVDLVLYSLFSVLLVAAMKSTGWSWLLWADLGGLAMFLVLRDVPLQGSPGKALTKLQIFAADVAPPTQRFGAIRRVVRNLPLLFPIGGVVAELVWMAYDPEKRRLGDRWARSRVVDGEPGRGDLGPALGAVVCLLIVVLLSYILPVHVLGIGG